MSDKLIIDRDWINRIHAIAKQGQNHRNPALAVLCCEDIQRMCLDVLTNAFENQIANEPEEFADANGN